MSARAVALSEVIAEARPGFASGSDLKDGIAQLRMNNLTRDGRLDWSKIRRVEPPRRVDHLLLEPGDVLFNATNSPELVGKTAFFDGFGEPITFSNHFLRLRPRREKLDGRYLAHWMQKQFASGRFARMCKQWVNQATVSRDLLLSLTIPLPPLDEQRRIAAILDKAEELRAKRRAAIALLDQLPQAIFLEMFGDPATNPKKWPRAELGQIAELARDGVSPHDIKTGTLFIGLENIKKGGGFESVSTVDEGELASTKFAFTPEHVLYGKLRPYLAKIALPDFEGVCSTDIIPILPGPKLDRRYLAHYLLTPKMIALASDRATGANLPRLSPSVLVEFPMPLPPIALQRQFAARVKGVERAKSAHQSDLAELDALFTSLQARAFSGQLSDTKELSHA